MTEDISVLRRSFPDYKIWREERLGGLGSLPAAVARAFIRTPWSRPWKTG